MDGRHLSRLGCGILNIPSKRPSQRTTERCWNDRNFNEVSTLAANSTQVKNYGSLRVSTPMTAFGFPSAVLFFFFFLIFFSCQSPQGTLQCGLRCNTFLSPGSQFRTLLLLILVPDRKDIQGQELWQITRKQFPPRLLLRHLRSLASLLSLTFTLIFIILNSKTTSMMFCLMPRYFALVVWLITNRNFFDHPRNFLSSYIQTLQLTFSLWHIYTYIYRYLDIFLLFSNQLLCLTISLSFFFRLSQRGCRRFL